TEREEFPEVAGLSRWIEVIDDDLALGWIIQFVLDAVVARDAIALGDEERALAERDTVRRVEALEDGLDFALAATIDDCVDVLREAVAHEHRALVAERERTRLGNAVNPHFHLESRRHLEFVDRQLACRSAGHLRR